jgi:hypothetical protein
MVASMEAMALTTALMDTLDDAAILQHHQEHHNMQQVVNGAH